MSDAAISEKEPKAFPVWAKVCCVIFVVAAALHSADKPIGGGDTWVAMACGRYMLGPWAQEQPNRSWQMRTLDKLGIHVTQRDPFSSTSRRYIPGDHKKIGWINQNWLTHVIFYKMKTVLGENSIVLYKFMQAILTALFAFWAARVLGAHYLLASGAAGFGVLLSRSFIDLRPNVSSILFAIIMILLLAYWKKNRVWALAWMIPVTIIWANVHGGFIYAIMIFSLVTGVHVAQFLVAQVWPNYFETMRLRAFGFLLATTIAVWVIPGIFSPFGWENLIHPLQIATGAEGKIWRQVIEWRPIWDRAGFGHAAPYVVFLSLFGLVFLIWWGLFFFKPVEPVLPSRRRQRPKVDPVAWPKINLSHLAIIAITVAMSLKSRRFIFLGGVILSPFLAAMAQDVFNMIALLRKKRKGTSLQSIPTMPQRFVFPSGVLSLLAALGMIGIYLACMRELYFLPQIDGHDYTVFRRMVGISAQPVDAMKFVSDNKISGVVLNEWTHGGFVAFHQVPQETTGEPPCKVFMDGRAQAAYALSQFQYWNFLKGVPAKPNAEAVKQLVTLMKQEKLDVHNPTDVDQLLERARRNEKLYRRVMKYTPHHPLLFAKVLEKNKINVAILDFSKPSSNGVLSLLLRSRRWEMIYLNDRYGVLVDTQAKINQPLLSKPLSYPSAFPRKFSQGLRLCQSSAPEARWQGMKRLMSIESLFFVQAVDNQIYAVGKALGRWDELQRFFSGKYAQLKEKYDRRERFGQGEILKGLRQCGRMLAQIAQQKNRPNEVKKYKKEMNLFGRLYRELAQEQMDGSWLW